MMDRLTIPTSLSIEFGALKVHMHDMRDRLQAELQPAGFELLANELWRLAQELNELHRQLRPLTTTQRTVLPN